jgi:dihydrofolate reductase
MTATSQRKLVLYIASSLDGYIATDDHNLNWLFNVEGEGDNGYTAFYETVDTILIGRITYIKEKLVDEIIVTIAPVLLGKGISLFENNSFETPLLLKSINRFNQFVELHYEVVRSHRGV